MPSIDTTKELSVFHSTKHCKMPGNDGKKLILFLLFSKLFYVYFIIHTLHFMNSTEQGKH